jgi:transposase
MRALSLDLRQRIVAAAEEGMTQTQIAQRFVLTQPTVSRILKQWHTEHDLSEKPKSGRPPRIAAEQLPALDELVASRTDWTLSELADAWQEHFSTRVGVSTLWRTLQKRRFTHKKRAGLQKSEMKPSEPPSEKP